MTPWLDLTFFDKIKMSYPVSSGVISATSKINRRIQDLNRVNLSFEVVDLVIHTVDAQIVCEVVR